MKKFIILSLFLLATACMLATASATEPTGYMSVTGPCNLEFPRDHGPHYGYRTEWWYYTGNLQAPSGEKYGFQLTFFRRQIRPSAEHQKWPQPTSAWRTQQIYMAHSAISNMAEKQHLQAELVARGALNMAGANLIEDTTSLTVRNWSAHIRPDRHLLKVQTDRFGFDLVLTPEKPPVKHGIDGYSRRGSTTSRASCYYSFSKLDTRGKLSIGDKIVAVKGSAWMDHEYGTDMLGPDLKGWDWFALQLSDKTEIMVYLIKSKEGGIAPTSSATVIGTKGLQRRLSKKDFEVIVRETWKSPNSRAIYPAGWQLRIFPELLELSITPNLADQEMLTTESTGTIYWEGSVSVAGSRAGKPVTGEGYVELTGYAGVFDAPM